jgi:class 3 adenylate cyclase
MNEESFGTIIQEFVGEMQRVIKVHRGYLEDISGDGIFGYIGNFNSRGSETDATDAVVMAVEMQLRLAELSTEFQSRYGLPEPLRMRIGISSGDALVGKTAGARAIYTANGDIVNLGAKLEQRLRDLTDAGGILISEQTAALVEEHFALTPRAVTIEGQEVNAYMVNQAQPDRATP